MPPQGCTLVPLKNFRAGHLREPWRKKKRFRARATSACAKDSGHLTGRHISFKKLNKDSNLRLPAVQ